MIKPSVEPPSGRPLLRLLQQQSTFSPALYVILRTPCVLPCKGREGKEGESEKKPELISISGQRVERWIRSETWDTRSRTVWLQLGSLHMLLAPQHLIGRHVRVAAQTSSSQRMRCLSLKKPEDSLLGRAEDPAPRSHFWGHDGFAPCGWAGRVEEWKSG